MPSETIWTTGIEPLILSLGNNAFWMRKGRLRRVAKLKKGGDPMFLFRPTPLGRQPIELIYYWTNHPDPSSWHDICLEPQSFEKTSPMISILIPESYVQPGLADHAASRPSAFPGDRKKRNHRPILSFYRWRPEAKRVQGPRASIADPRSYHGLPIHTVQCYFGYSSSGKFFILSLRGEKGREQNIAFWDSL